MIYPNLHVLTQLGMEDSQQWGAMGYRILGDTRYIWVHGTDLKELPVELVRSMPTTYKNSWLTGDSW